MTFIARQFTVYNCYMFNFQKLLFILKIGVFLYSQYNTELFKIIRYSTKTKILRYKLGDIQLIALSRILPGTSSNNTLYDQYHVLFVSVYVLLQLLLLSYKHKSCASCKCTHTSRPTYRILSCLQSETPPRPCCWLYTGRFLRLPLEHY